MYVLLEGKMAVVMVRKVMLTMAFINVPACPSINVLHKTIKGFDAV